jgi:hypothetical protein
MCSFVIVYAINTLTRDLTVQAFQCLMTIKRKLLPDVTENTCEADRFRLLQLLHEHRSWGPEQHKSRYSDRTGTLNPRPIKKCITVQCMSEILASRNWPRVGFCDQQIFVGDYIIRYISMCIHIVTCRAVRAMQMTGSSSGDWIY